ncbi:sporulation protein [Bacillus licheniformis]
MLFRIFLFSGIFVFLLTMSALHPLSYFYDLIGIALGLILTAYALKHVSIENRGGVLYFRTHLWIELIVLLLFLYRFLYRIAEIGQLQTAVSDGGSAAYGALFAQDPATMIGFLYWPFIMSVSLFCFKKGRSEEKRSA